MDYKGLLEITNGYLSSCKKIRYGECVGASFPRNNDGPMVYTEPGDILLDLNAIAITDLLARAEAAEARAEKAERERDAAVKDLRQMCVGGNTCAFCKYGRNCGKQGPGRKTVEPCWEWRGQKEE